MSSERRMHVQFTSSAQGGLNHSLLFIYFQGLFLSLAVTIVINSDSKDGDSNHCVKSVRIRSYSGPNFPTFSPNARKNEPE